MIGNQTVRRPCYLAAIYAGIFVATLMAGPAKSSPQSDAQRKAQQTFQEIDALPWVSDGSGDIGGVAAIKASPSARFLAQGSSARFIALSGNPPEENTSILAPRDLRWFSFYHFNDVGYVTDTEKIDPDALLKNLLDNEAADNEERQKLGLESLTIIN